MGDIWKEIYDSSLKFLVPLDTEETYMVVAKEAIKLAGGGYASIFLLDNDELKKVYTTHEEHVNIEPRKDGVTYEAFHTGVAKLRHNQELVKANRNFEVLPYGSNMSVPLVYGHLTLGVLSLLSPKGRRYTEENLDVLSLFAPLATLAVRKAYLNEELHNALEVRDLFTSLAAHELKTPLTVILAYNDSLLKSLKGEKQRKYALKIKRNAQRMKNLINEFLQVDLKNKGELHYNFKMIEIVTLVKKVVDNFIAINTSRKFTFDVPTKRIFVKIDIEKIIEVIYNFLNNAVKFSPEGSEIDIKLSFDRGEFVLSVTDHGDGIQQKDLNHIFEKFNKGSSKKTGMGLGLYLSKQIIEDHKGDISIKSEIGKGTTISFSLPVFSK
jgi:signal transduction histidine kinase